MAARVRMWYIALAAVPVKVMLVTPKSVVTLGDNQTMHANRKIRKTQQY